MNLGVRHILRMGVVGLWNDPGLKRRARGVRSDHHEMIGFLDKADSRNRLPAQECRSIRIAPCNRSTCVRRQFPPGLVWAQSAARSVGNAYAPAPRRQLRRDSCTSSKITQTYIAPQIQNAIAIRPKQIFDALLRHIGEGLKMLRTFDDHFVRANTIHLVVQTFGFTCQSAFDPQE